MDIFSQTEGLRGENLGSVLLTYLMFNSQEIRDSILSLFSDKSPIGPLTYASHFACRTEYPTGSEEYGDGRLDILIQLDDVIIGIENKFFAEFQNNQPVKYLEPMKKAAAALKNINHSEVREILFICCPESRKREALKKIQGFQNTNVITWEEISSVRLRIK